MNSITQIIEDINRTNENFKKIIALNQKQTADVIGVSSSTLEAWRREGIGPEYIKVNNGKKGRILYPKNSIAEWLSQTVKTA